MKNFLLITILCSVLLASCSMLKCSVTAGANLNSGQVCLTCKTNDTITFKKILNVKLSK